MTYYQNANSYSVDLIALMYIITLPRQNTHYSQLLSCDCLSKNGLVHTTTELNFYYPGL